MRVVMKKLFLLSLAIFTSSLRAAPIFLPLEDDAYNEKIKQMDSQRFRYLAKA